MKKNIFVAAILVATTFLSGCEDKEAQAKLAEQTQIINQLTTENTQLKAALNAEKAKLENIIPAIFAEKEFIFEASEMLPYPKSYHREGEEEFRFEIATLHTNIDWLNAKLLNAIQLDKTKNLDKTQLAEAYKAFYQKTKTEMAQGAVFGIDKSLSIYFLRQKGKLATFIVNDYEFGGGAHGAGHSYFLNFDLDTRKQIEFNDVFKADSQAKLNALLWEKYTDYGARKDVDMRKENFKVNTNFDFNDEGFNFHYNPGELEPDTQTTLALDWAEIEDLLKPEFIQQKYISSFGE